MVISVTFGDVDCVQEGMRLFGYSVGFYIGLKVYRVTWIEELFCVGFIFVVSCFCLSSLLGLLFFYFELIV